jgi:hypothetical protein
VTADALLSTLCQKMILNQAQRNLRMIPLTFASSIAHIHDMYNRDPGLSRVIARTKVGHV